MAVKHTHEQCQMCVKAIRDLVEKAYVIEDKKIRHHHLENTLQLCDQLLREPTK
jgi:hypothetical protein